MVEILLIGLVIAAFVVAYRGIENRDTGADASGSHAVHARQADEDDGGWDGGDGGDGGD